MLVELLTLQKQLSVSGRLAGANDIPVFVGVVGFAPLPIAPAFTMGTTADELSVD